MKRRPRFSSTKDCTAGTHLSGRMQRSTHILASESSDEFHGSGSGAFCGSRESYTARHASMLAETCSSIPLNCGSVARLMNSIQTLSSSHSAVGFARPEASAPPESRKRHCPMSTLPAVIRILMQSRKENMSLCSSKMERHTLT